MLFLFVSVVETAQVTFEGVRFPCGCLFGGGWGGEKKENCCFQDAFLLK